MIVTVVQQCMTMKHCEVGEKRYEAIQAEDAGKNAFTGQREAISPTVVLEHARSTGEQCTLI